MTISVVIPAFNEEKYLSPCLQSILAQRTAEMVRIIVVDNASTDGTAAIARSFPGVTVVREDHKGLLFARQRGLMESTGDLIAYIDADSTVSPGWFARIVREFSADPHLVALSGPYRYKDGELPMVQHLLTSVYWNVLARLTYAVTRFMLVGGNFVAKREALQKIGGFDTTIAFYGEDTNTARRLHAVGTVKFSTSFFVYSSARRMRDEGFLKSAFVYMGNYFSEAFFHRPMTQKYKDIR